MISELIQHFLYWGDVWYAHPRTLRAALRSGRWHVGTWTGPDDDLICVRPCRTSEEAEQLLSPGSRTILGATLKSLVKLYRTRSIDTGVRLAPGCDWFLQQKEA